jgi:hypothetical protein
MGIPPPGNAMVKGLRGLIKPRVEGFAIVISTLEIFSCEPELGPTGHKV